MLNKYIKFDGVQIPNPISYSEDSEVIENQYETEAGGLNVSVTRYDRLHVSVSFNVSSTWAKKLKAFSKQKYVTVSLFDLTEDDYINHQMIIRNFKSNLIEHSEYLISTNGLWKVSFELQEL